MAETVRFAPSPTGHLHLGNVRTALFNWFLATGSGGTFVLRYDDTDAARSEARFATVIAEDLAWLGIVPDRVERQSERLARYDAAADRLREAGLLYAAYETPEELDRKRARQRARGLPPIYDRAALSLTEADRQRLEGEGRRPHWRFKLPGGARGWDDLCRGPQTVNLSSVSDPVLVREDGSYLYTLPSVVDDMEFSITTIVRGEDHVTNSGVQIAIFEALGGAVPRFAHHNLLTRRDGEPLSKRDNPLGVANLRAAGYEPMAVASLAVLVGTSHPVEPVADLCALAASVELSDVSKGPATFDPHELDRLNAALVHELPAGDIAPLVPNVADRLDAFWEAVRGNCAFRHEAKDWANHLTAAPERLLERVRDEDAEVLGPARELLPDEPWDETTFKAWTGAVREATGRKGKALFMPLRRALTGQEAGPEMGPWLLLLGRERAAERLSAALRVTAEAPAADR